MQPDKPKASRKVKAPVEPEVQAQSHVKQVLPFEVYNSIISHVVPVEVKLIDLSFSIKSPSHSGPLYSTSTLGLPEIVNESTSNEGSSFYTVDHRVAFKIEASDDCLVAEGRAVLSVKLRLELKPPEEFWELFLERNIKLYTYPVLRELVSSLATRAGLICQPLSSVAVSQSIKKNDFLSG